MPNPDEEPNQPASDDQLDEEFEVCAYCGTTLPKEKWCPVVTETDADGDFIIRSFCDEVCKEAWINNDY